MADPRLVVAGPMLTTGQSELRGSSSRILTASPIPFAGRVQHRPSARVALVTELAHHDRNDATPHRAGGELAHGG